MKHSDFKIGTEFTTGLHCQKWRCTDVGSRTIVAIKIDDRPDQSWFDGPPFYVEEIVFSDFDLAGCTYLQG